MQIESCNYIRATHAPIDPTSCRRSDHERDATDLSNFSHVDLDGGYVSNLHEACTFRLAPVHRGNECEDHAACDGQQEECMDADFRQFMRKCPKLCANCGDCVDHEDACQKWSAAGQCFLNAAFMLPKCPHSCIEACEKVLYDPHPPYFVTLWNGLLMPTTGFGTAGLGNDSYMAVLEALDTGYRFDLSVVCQFCHSILRACVKNADQQIRSFQKPSLWIFACIL